MENNDVSVWVVDDAVDQSTMERVGEARLVTEHMGGQVGSIVVTNEVVGAQTLIHGGADVVINAVAVGRGTLTFVATIASVLKGSRAKLVLCRGDARGRERAARLAARLNWKLVSPALMVRAARDRLSVTHLDPLEHRSRQVACDATECIVVTLKPGVADALELDPSRVGRTAVIACDGQLERETTEAVHHAEPADADIRHLDRLIAGGKGMGGTSGFDRLTRIAAKLRAGVAASRVAVDLQWAPRERQVGQTGKTVAPKLYVACGISGASHHLEGMSRSEHIIAVNSDPAAPIFRVSHLGCECDVFELLDELDLRLKA